jgi:hypothetical protein
VWRKKLRRRDKNRTAGRRLRLAIALSAGALLSAPSALRAWTWPAEALLTQMAAAPWRFGPIRFRPQIVFSDFGYDSNIYHQPDAVDDFSMTAGPQATAYLRLQRKIVLTVTESPRYNYYLRTARERAWNNFFNARAAFLLNNFFIQVGTHADNARQRLSYEIDLRPRVKDTGIDAWILWQPTPKSSFSAGFKRTRFRYADNTAEYLNIGDRLGRDETLLNLTFYNQIASRTRAFIDFEYGRADFERADSLRDAQSYAVSGGFDFSPRGRIRGRVRIGYKTFHPLSAGLPAFKGLVGDSSLSIILMRPLVLRAAYSRDVRFSVWFDNPYFIEQVSGGGLSVYFNRRRIRLDYDYAEVRYDYPVIAAPSPGGAGPAVSPARRDLIAMNTVGLFFRIGKNVGLGVRAGHYSRHLNIFGWRTNRDFVGLSLTYEF